MLDEKSFRSVVAAAPLASIDICLVVDHCLLMGCRNNEPLKGQWFTPGGCIKKNEPWQDALLRIAKTELGFDVGIEAYKLMGIWDHFYTNSFADPNLSTHYINLPQVCYLDDRPDLVLDSQHSQIGWFPLNEITTDAGYHDYMCSYASWIIRDSECGSQF